MKLFPSLCDITLLEYFKIRVNSLKTWGWALVWLSLIAKLPLTSLLIKISLPTYGFSSNSVWPMMSFGYSPEVPSSNIQWHLLTKPPSLAIQEGIYICVWNWISFICKYSWQVNTHFSCRFWPWTSSVATIKQESLLLGYLRTLH